MDDSPLLYYRHSNRVPPLSLMISLLVGLAGGAVAASLYALSIIYIPFIYLNVILMLVLGVFLGWLVAKLMTWGKVRSPLTTMSIALLVTLASYYVHWVVWLCVVFGRSGIHLPLLRLMDHPRIVFYLIQRTNAFGTWSMTRGDSNMTGIALTGIWVVEAAGIFWAAIFAARSSLNEAPFCETCGVWCPDRKAFRRVQWANPARREAKS